MAKTFIKGDLVENATSYELLEKTASGEYNTLATDTEINFEVSAMPFEAGNHTLVVQAHAEGYESSDYSNELTYTVEASDNVVFDFDFTTNTIDDYALSDIFTVPEGSTTSDIVYDTNGANLNDNLPYGLTLIDPIDASRAWTMEFTGTIVAPTDLVGNRKAFLTGVSDIVPLVVLNSSSVDNFAWQISAGTHRYVGGGQLIYDTEASYRITHDGAGNVVVYQNGSELGTTTVDFTGKQFGTILGVIKGKSSAYIWKDVETGKKSYLKKLKFYYN